MRQPAGFLKTSLIPSITFRVLAGLVVPGLAGLSSAHAAPPSGAPAGGAQEGALSPSPEPTDDIVDDDWDLTVDDDSNASLLLPSFALGATSRRMPLAPPVGRTKQIWLYRYDVDLGYRFRREEPLHIEASVGGSLSYPIRLVESLGRPVVSFGLRGEARLVGRGPVWHDNQASEASSWSHTVSSEWWTSLGITGQEIQYARHSLDAVQVYAAGGVRVFWTPHSPSSFFSRGHSLVALFSGQVMPPPSYYKTTQSNPTERFDEAAQFPSPFSWKSRGAASAWALSSELAWMASPGGSEPGDAPSVRAPALPRDSVALGYEYGEGLFEGLLESGQDGARRRVGIHTSEQFLYVRWRRLFAATSEGAPQDEGQ